MAVSAAAVLRLIVLQFFKTIDWRKYKWQKKSMPKQSALFSRPRVTKNLVLGAVPQARYGAGLSKPEFIPLHGMLMEVTPEQYAEFYRIQNRQRYMDRRSADNGDISVDMLTTDEFNGADILVDPGESIDELVIRKMQTDKLIDCLSLLEQAEQLLIRDLFYNGLTSGMLPKVWCVAGCDPQAKAAHSRKNLKI